MFSFICDSKPPSNRLCTCLKILYLRIRNWFIGNVLSTFYSAIGKILSVKINLFLIELTHFWLMFHIWMQVDDIPDLHLYLKCHSHTSVFQTFCQQKSTTWFQNKWNIGWKCINIQIANNDIINMVHFLLLNFQNSAFKHWNG